TKRPIRIGGAIQADEDVIVASRGTITIGAPIRAGRDVGIANRDGWLEVSAALPADRWVWVNLWATWCVPCKREIPLLVTWRDQLRRDGVPFDLVFVSVDDTGGVLADFLGSHPDVAPEPSLRLLQPKGLESWLGRYQPEPSGSIPVHLIAAPGLEVRCVRAGSLREGDYPTVRALMR
ncbi:MAG: TlpA family protein disulfide reductase, partial [Holophagae bacterium]|nr:TlpA family protein disulfide reductase [Holophagae bacterium]